MLTGLRCFSKRKCGPQRLCGILFDNCRKNNERKECDEAAHDEHASNTEFFGDKSKQKAGY